MTPSDLVEQLLDESFGFKAAVRISGKIYVGAIHGDALIKAADAGALRRFGVRDSNDMESANWDRIESSIESGFVKDGQFMSRKQAEELIKGSGRSVQVSRDDGISAEDLATIRK